MKRRTLLGGVVVIGGGYFAHDRGLLPDSIQEQVDEQLSGDPSEQTFSLSSNFEKVEWSVGPTLTVHVDYGGKMDGFAIRHRTGDDSHDDLIRIDLSETNRPEFPLDFQDVLRQGHPPYPSRKFTLVAYEGVFGNLNVIDETLETVGFSAPAQYVEDRWFQADG